MTIGRVIVDAAAQTLAAKATDDAPHTAGAHEAGEQEAWEAEISAPKAEAL